MSTLEALWDKLEPAWRDTFELMWESFRAGSIPVGAVLVDGSGVVVARGRNRIFETDAPSPQLAGSRLAHAEMNALAGLPSERTYEQLTLYTALEPCPLCLGAAQAVRVGRVRYASADPYGGAVSALVPTRDMLAHPVEVDGPLPGPFGALPELLHVAHFLRRRPDGDVIESYRELRPDVLVAAKACLTRRIESESVVEAIVRLSDLLTP